MSQRASSPNLPISNGDPISDRNDSVGLPSNEDVLERVFSKVATTSAFEPTPVTVIASNPSTATHAAPSVGLMAARIESWSGKREINLRLTQSGELVQGELLPELDLGLVEDAVRERQLVMVERQLDKMVVIGVIATQKPRKLKIDADSIEILASKSLLLRVGRAALELRHDGTVELVGSRISASSRGLFRLVGRMLRLN